MTHRRKLSWIAGIAIAVVLGGASYLGGGLTVTPATYTVALTATGNTTLTLPVTGKLATQAQIPYAGFQILGKLTGADFNVTTDQPITLTYAGSGFKIGTGSSSASGGGVLVKNCTDGAGTPKTPTLAAGTVYTGSGKTGTAFGTATDTYTGATGINRIVLNNGTSTSVSTFLNPTTVYFSLTTANGSALTCDIIIMGLVFP